MALQAVRTSFPVCQRGTEGGIVRLPRLWQLQYDPERKTRIRTPVESGQKIGPTPLSCAPPPRELIPTAFSVHCVLDFDAFGFFWVDALDGVDRRGHYLHIRIDHQRFQFWNGGFGIGPNLAQGVGGEAAS
jgi:hypothetical protein